MTDEPIRKWLSDILGDGPEEETIARAIEQGDVEAARLRTDLAAANSRADRAIEANAAMHAVVEAADHLRLHGTALYLAVQGFDHESRFLENLSVLCRDLAAMPVDERAAQLLALVDAVSDHEADHLPVPVLDALNAYRGGA